MHAGDEEIVKIAHLHPGLRPVDAATALLRRRRQRLPPRRRRGRAGDLASADAAGHSPNTERRRRQSPEQIPGRPSARHRRPHRSRSDEAEPATLLDRPARRNTPGSEGGGPSPGGGPRRPSRRARTLRAGSVRRRRLRSPNILRTRTVGNGDGEAALHVRRLSSLQDRNVAPRPVDGPPALVVLPVTVPAGAPEHSREGAGASRAHTDSVMVDTPIGPARITAGREGGAPMGGLEAMTAETDRKDAGALPSSSPGSARHRCAACLRTEAWRQECRTGVPTGATTWDESSCCHN